MKVQEYEHVVAETDRFGAQELLPVCLGLFGEVGGAFSAAKKQRREQDVFVKYRLDVEEEFGDIFWYFVAICRRCGISLRHVLSEVFNDGQCGGNFAAGTFQTGQLVLCTNPQLDVEFEASMRDLGKQASAILDIDPGSKQRADQLAAFCRAYFRALNALELDFETVTSRNVQKVRGRFIQPDVASLPNFDYKFHEDERIPEYFEIEIAERSDGRTHLRWNGVFIGDPLADNIADGDGFRFHDVFHFAHAAVLHWSPTFRSLIRHKRKSDPQIEEEQDSGRAIVVEEGLTALIFSQAKQLAFFDGHDGVSFDLLKTVAQFVEGYEVEECPLKLWEDAILQGYAVFRKVVDRGGGIIVGDRSVRKIFLKE